MWPNSGPKVFPHRHIRSSGSQTTNESVVSPPPRYRHQLHPSAADFQDERVREIKIDVGHALAGQAGGTETSLDRLDAGAQRVFEGEGTAAGPIRDEALVVVAPEGPVRLCDNLCPGSRTLSRPPTWSTWPWVKMM